MSSRDIEGATKPVFFFSQLCVLLTSLRILPFTIAVHNAQRRRQADGMSAKAREHGLSYATSGVWWSAPLWKIHHYISVALPDPGRDFPELTIGPEGANA